jgi:hypothetical protein
LLNTPAISRDVNFFDLGGTSLLMVRIHAELQATIAPSLKITDLFANPTVAGLARFIAGQAADRTIIHDVGARAARQAQALRTVFRPARKT